MKSFIRSVASAPYGAKAKGADAPARRLRDIGRVHSGARRYHPSGRAYLPGPRERRRHANAADDTQSPPYQGLDAADHLHTSPDRTRRVLAGSHKPPVKHAGDVARLPVTTRLTRQGACPAAGGRRRLPSRAKPGRATLLRIPLRKLRIEQHNIVRCCVGAFQGWGSNATRITQMRNGFAPHLAVERHLAARYGGRDFDRRGCRARGPKEVLQLPILHVAAARRRWCPAPWPGGRNEVKQPKVSHPPGSATKLASGDLPVGWPC